MLYTAGVQYILLKYRIVQVLMYLLVYIATFIFSFHISFHQYLRTMGILPF
jgi:hypothetical protein